MAEPRYFPFDGVEENGVYDRAYLSADFADYFKKFIANGVYNGYKNSLQVFSLNENMVLTIKSGAACIEGRGYEQDEDVIIQLEAANANFARYDLIVCQLDYLNRLIKVAAKTGTPTSSPVKPVVQRDSDIYEIALAEVYVSSGATKITQANITDKRPDSSVCGWVHGVIDQVDTSDLYAQYEDYWNMVKAQIDSDMSQFASGFNLYGVASGSGTYTATVSGFVLVEGINVKIKFPNGSTGQATLNINGLGAKNIVRADGSAYPIKAGTIQNLVYDGTNFTLLNEGGWGTATAASVLPGETFTNDDGFQTGAMPSNGDVSTSIVNGVLLKGYTDGGAIANLVPNNVAYQINIGGVIGAMPPMSMSSKATISLKKNGYTYSSSYKNSWQNLGAKTVNKPITFCTLKVISSEGNYLILIFPHQENAFIIDTSNINSSTANLTKMNTYGKLTGITLRMKCGSSSYDKDGSEIRYSFSNSNKTITFEWYCAGCMYGETIYTDFYSTVYY